jgi:hypothetical protein
VRIGARSATAVRPPGNICCNAKTNKTQKKLLLTGLQNAKRRISAENCGPCSANMSKMPVA